ncbi:dystroglycan isoform X3 [Musca autumnalis]|uniref:dystroglycan isoform X3 n=1 Tax=Musca autumnalis TaxID=221902 RepID=UPI003CEAE261
MVAKLKSRLATKFSDATDIDKNCHSHNCNCSSSTTTKTRTGTRKLSMMPSTTTNTMMSASSPYSSSPSTSPSSTSSRTTRRWCNLTKTTTHPLVLYSFVLLLVLHPVISNAERDFNFNDSQVPLIEPKDEPTLIEGHHHTAAAASSHHNHQHQHQTSSSHHHKHQDPYAVELSHCRYGDNELVLSLVLQTYNWHDLNESRRAKVLAKLSKFFAIPKEFITMESVTKHDLYEMQKESLKKGNNKCHTNNNRKLGRVDFIIGCRSTYFSITEPIVKQIEQQFKDGALDNITGEKFGWWIIWRKHYKNQAPVRNRRQIEGSGLNEEEDDDDYEYDDDEDTGFNAVDSSPSTTATSQNNYNNNNDNNEDDADNEDYYDTTLEPEDNEETSSSKMASSSTPAEDPIYFASSTNPPTQTTTQSSSSPAVSTTQELPSTTSAVPDYIEPVVENTPPMIKSRLQKLAVTSGKSFKFAIPDDTFYDTEDMTNLRLELTDKEGRELKSNSWLQFNAETKEVYGLPLDDSVSKWQYRLTATDSGNESVVETFEISVQQHRGVRTVNHEVNIAVKINEKNMHYIDWQMKLIKAIATTLGDENTSSIVVREIRANPQDPSIATLVYFNETLPTSECPETELNNLVKRLDANRLSDLVYPTLGVKSITGQLIGPCQKLAAKPKTPTISVKNSPPVPRNQVDRVVATAGHLLVYKVPSDTFFDDGKITLSLKTKDHKELSPTHWLQFDSKNEEFYGIPKPADVGPEEYMLEAEDTAGLTATDALVVLVNPAPKKEFSVYFKASLGVKHENFHADLQRKFVERIAQLFGDASAQNIQIRSVNPIHDTDSTAISFYNTTLYKMHNRCPEEEIEAVRSVYLQDGGMRDRVRKALGSELNITNIQMYSLSCNEQTNIIHRDYVPAKPDEPLLKSTFSDDYLYTIILPAIIIVSMILIASIIACCLHRRRRKSGKMELGDEEERKSFRTKGIPVIFQDELDEKPEIGNKSPIILKNEKPPLLPPSYNTSNMNGDNDCDEYVPPPAVVVGGREARGKSPATPSYRKPPPYVSP